MMLFVNCCPRGESRTEKLARALLKALGEYEELRLYDEPLHPPGRRFFDAVSPLKFGPKKGRLTPRPKVVT